MRKNICIVGAGSFGTALANAIARKDQPITLFSIEEEVVKSINEERKNCKYFQNIQLKGNINAVGNIECLSNFDLLFFAIPSHAVVNFVENLSGIITCDTILVNLAKGFGKNNETIYESLKAKAKNPVCALKGPTFAAELINQYPSAFTLGFENENIRSIVENVFFSSCIKLDNTTDILGVELLSILKNIYAIIVGIIDALHNSANVRFLVINNAINEMRKILKLLGANEETVFRYCGIGDLGLTALNDLSRNRTLGLLIGKGFYTNNINDSVVLEGRRALDIFHYKLKNSSCEDIKMIESLYNFFNTKNNLNSFLQEIVHD